MFLLPKVFLVAGTFPPAVVAATVAVWLTTLLIIEATPPMGWTCNSSVEAFKREPGSELPSVSVLILVGLVKELFKFDAELWPAFDVTRRKQQAWWRHLLGWHRKQEVDCFGCWVEVILILSGSSVSLSGVGLERLRRSLKLTILWLGAALNSNSRQFCLCSLSKKDLLQLCLLLTLQVLKSNAYNLYTWFFYGSPVFPHKTKISTLPFLRIFGTLLPPPLLKSFLDLMSVVLGNQKISVAGFSGQKALAYAARYNNQMCLP